MRSSMRIPVDRSGGQTARSATRVARSEPSVQSAPGHNPELPQAQPPAELIALQRLIARRTTPPADVRPESDDQQTESVQTRPAVLVQRAPPPEVEATSGATGSTAAPATAPPVQDMIYGLTAEGDRSGRAPAKKPEWTATLKERNQEVGKQASDGTFELKDSSKLKLTDTGTLFGPTSGNRVLHPVQPDQTQGVGLLNGATSLDVQNYNELTPAAESSKFSARYEFKGDARAGLVGLIKAKQTEEKKIDNALSDDQKLRKRTFGELQVVELTVKGTSVSANSEGAINNPRDDSHSYDTSIKQRVPAGEFYQPVKLAVFQAMLTRLQAGKAAVARRPPPPPPAAPAPATPATGPSNTAPAGAPKSSPASTPTRPPAPDADDIAAAAYDEIYADSRKAILNAENLGFFVTATASRGYGPYPKLKVFLKANFPEYTKDGVAAESYFEKDKVTDSETNIPVNLFQNFISGFVHGLRPYFPVGALGIMWIDGKEGSAQAFYIGDSKGPGEKESTTRLEAPKTLLAKVDGANVTSPATGPGLQPADIESIKRRVSELNDKPYELKGQILHVLIFPRTASEDEFFVSRSGLVIRKQDANDPFGILQRYLRARSAGLT